MVGGMSKHLMVEHEINKQASRVLEILLENRTGLTSRQIAKHLGGHMRSNLLARLRKEGKVKQTRGLLYDGRVAVIYVLNMSKKESQATSRSK